MTQTTVTTTTLESCDREILRHVCELARRYTVGLTSDIQRSAEGLIVGLDEHGCKTFCEIQSFMNRIFDGT